MKVNLADETQDTGVVDIGHQHRENDLSGGTFWTDSVASADQMARAIMAGTGATVVPGSASFTGAEVASGFFGNGNSVGLNGHVFPIDHGVIFASGSIHNAHGPNNDSGDSSAADFNYGSSDSHLNLMVGGGPTDDAAVLEFNIVSPNPVTLEFQYVFASEEYPEWLAEAGGFNDLVAIFISETFDGTEWVITPADNIATVPGTTTPVSVNSINGGVEDSLVFNVDWVDPSNPDYYVDNADPEYDPLVNAAEEPVFNLQYDGFTLETVEGNYIPLSASGQLSAGTYRVKIAIADYEDWLLDSAVFIQAVRQCQ
jgi:hypothetical protein